jgi:hypothetical protein
VKNKVGPKQPPAASRFRKGQSGNPKGRPRKSRADVGSAFDMVIERTLTLTHSGQPREVTLEEALQQKTYQEALAGNRSARREVLKMIAKREHWLAKSRPQRHTVERLMEPTDPTNAHAALLLLGIAEPNARWTDGNDANEHLLLEPWAVQAALDRRRGWKLTEKEVSEIRRCTRAAETLRWPGGTPGSER